MPATITYTDSLTVTSCWCGIKVAIPNDLYRQARENGHRVWCPLGHTFVWGETETDRLRARAEQLKADQRWYAQRLNAERDLRLDTERRLSAQRGATTRARNQRDRDRTRVAAGVCPCCNRTFKNLARHMAGQHPDFGPLGHDDGDGDG